MSTSDEIRSGFAYVPARTSDMRWSEEEAAKFDRWLERHNAEIKAEALQEAADGIQALHPGETKASVVWLRERAARVADTTDTEGGK